MLVVQVIASFELCPISCMVNLVMNVRSTGVQFMSNNPERFIESSTDHLWSRYLAYMG